MVKSTCAYSTLRFNIINILLYFCGIRWIKKNRIEFGVAGRRKIMINSSFSYLQESSFCLILKLKYLIYTFESYEFTIYGKLFRSIRRSQLWCVEVERTMILFWNKRVFDLSIINSDKNYYERIKMFTSAHPRTRLIGDEVIWGWTCMHLQ